MLLQNHLNELKNSNINDDIIALNFKSLQGDLAYEYLLYSLNGSARRNDGRLRDNYLKRYQHLDHGGWWCSGIDLKTLERSEWGCFKPDIPYIENGKPRKYEHPPAATTGIFTLDVSREQFSKIANKSLEEIEGLNFWQWVIDNPVSVIVTEGAKKTACLLSNDLVSLALPGIWNGVKDDVLIPELQILSKVSREWIIAFDQDTKWTTQNDVYRATKKLGDHLLKWNESAEISVMEWAPSDGKGIDDVVSRKGQGLLAEIYETRLTFDEYNDKYGKVKYLDRPGFLEFVERQLSKRLNFNELTTYVELDNEPLEFDDSLIFKFIRDFRVDTSQDNLSGALLDVAKNNSYHPVVRYLKQCHETVQPIRIDNLSTRYFGTKDPIYDKMVHHWLIGAVARAFEPGCKMDFALLLQSKSKGIGKSTFFSVLGGDWYNGSLPDTVSSNKDYLVLSSAWMHEWAEFDKVTRKSDAAKIKDFVTCATDTYVPPYGKRPKKNPRRSVLCGTVNEEEFLQDPEGERRFLIIPVSPTIKLIDNIQLAAERDQIWAAATQAYLEGKKQAKNVWVIPREMEQKIIQLSKGYIHSDEWQFLIADYLEGKETTSITDILTEALCVEPARQDRKEQMRVSKALVVLGWEKGKVTRIEDDEGKIKRRQVWVKLPTDSDDHNSEVDPTNLEVDPLSQNSQDSSVEPVLTTGSTSEIEKVDPEVDPKVDPRQNGHHATVTAIVDQPTVPFSTQNFFSENQQQDQPTKTKKYGWDNSSEEDIRYTVNFEKIRLEVSDEEFKVICRKLSGKSSYLDLSRSEVVKLIYELRAIDERDRDAIANLVRSD